MAGNISFKKAVIIFFYCGIVIILSACMVPIDIDAFMSDQQVKELIETISKTVKLDDKTGDSLKGLSEKIEGLKPDKYYMIEKEKDAKDNLVPNYPKYVTDYPGIGPGGLGKDLGLITKIKGGSINDLTDFHTYTVKSAAPLSGVMSYFDDRPGFSKTVTGVINIDDISGTGHLNLSKVLSGEYEVIAVSDDTISNNPWKWKSQNISSWNSFELIGAETEVDYVFVKKDASLDFKVLRVKIGPIAQIGIALTVAFNNGEMISISPENNNINISSQFSLTITLSVTGGGKPDKINWYYNDDLKNPISTENSLSLDNEFISKNEVKLVCGTHIFTVVAEIGGVPYSKSFTITVEDNGGS